MEVHQLADARQEFQMARRRGSVCYDWYAISLCTSAVIRYLRGVPDACPACSSHRLASARLPQDFPTLNGRDRRAISAAGLVNLSRSSMCLNRSTRMRDHRPKVSASFRPFLSGR